MPAASAHHAVRAVRADRVPRGVPGPARLDARLIVGLPGRGHLGARAHPRPARSQGRGGRVLGAPLRERQRERERRVQAAVVEQVRQPGVVRVRDPPPLRQQHIADRAAVAGVDHGEHLEGTRVHSRAPGLPAGLAAPLADLDPDPAAASSAAVISAAGPPPTTMMSIASSDLSACSMKIKIINVNEYDKPCERQDSQRSRIG